MNTVQSNPPSTPTTEGSPGNRQPRWWKSVFKRNRGEATPLTNKILGITAAAILLLFTVVMIITAHFRGLLTPEHLRSHFEYTERTTKKKIMSSTMKVIESSTKATT
uniref:Cytochrome b n=1 Tax=Lygus hesperus TaxID=30085 RepID=A0A0A9YGX4_LYGHE